MSWFQRPIGIGSGHGGKLSSHYKSSRWCSALDVTTFEEFYDLIVLEQFIDCVPLEVGTHIIERGKATVSEAATIADEYVLAHKGKSRRNYSTDLLTAKPVTHSKFTRFESSRPRHFPKSQSSDQLCNYCYERGHWKTECAVFKSKGGHFSAKNVQPAAFTALARRKRSSVSDAKAKNYSGFEAFVSDGFVSLGGNDSKVPVKILKDTGAINSFIRASVLPFSAETDTGDCVIVKGGYFKCSLA